MEKKLVTILGPTASGKTKVAVALAQRLDGEIISADSRQVYRGMDIGTGKDLSDYLVYPPTPNTQHPTPNIQHPTPSTQHPTPIPYHLINICEAGEKYNLYRYQEDFKKALEDIRSRDKWPILCGGTGLYIESVLRGYNLANVPQNPSLRLELKDKSLEELTEMLVELKKKNGSNMHNKTDVDTVQRAIRAIEIELASPQPSPEEGGSVDSLIIGIDIDRELRREKISQRLHDRLEEGMIDEIKGIIDSGVKPEDLIYYGLEYKFVTQYVIGQLSREEMERQLEIAIHQFAKRQMTWFRGMERRGFSIHWIDAKLPMQCKIEEILQILLK